MTQTLKQKISEVKKGCGRLVDDDYAGTTPLDDYTCLENNLCPTCQAKLSAFQEVQDIFIEIIDKWFDGRAINLEDPTLKVIDNDDIKELKEGVK